MSLKLAVKTLAAAAVTVAIFAPVSANAQAVTVSVVQQAPGSAVLDDGERLTANKYRQSPNGLYRLVQGGDGNLVLLDMSTKKALWSSQTHGNAGAYTVMQHDGNLVVKSAAGKALWSTKTFGNAGARLVVQNDGNAVIYSSSDQALWASVPGNFTLRADETLESNKYRQSANKLYRLVQGGDGNLVLLDTSTKKALWSSQTHGNAGAYTVMQHDGNLVVKSAAGKALWSTKTFGNAGARLVVQNDGNAVIYSSSDQALWSTKTAS
ncbi:hypothetical protein [Nonomuraea fuscirosea]|uniref:hypothetical protein n=1 Tax=Nonomuraea fuscirosea TaxID=1291556 RepID=UPI0034242EBB